jgi:hypothetical protein
VPTPFSRPPLRWLQSSVHCTVSDYQYPFFVLGVILHPKAKLFVPFVDNAMMIVVHSKITLLPPWACKDVSM